MRFNKIYKNAFHSSNKTFKKKGNYLRWYMIEFMSLLSYMFILMCPLMLLARIRTYKEIAQNKNIVVTKSFKAADNPKAVWTLVLAYMIKFAIIFGIVCLILAFTGLLGLVGFGLYLLTGQMALIFIFAAPGAVLLLAFFIYLPYMFASIEYVVDDNADIGASKVVFASIDSLKKGGKLALFVNNVIFGAFLSVSVGLIAGAFLLFYAVIGGYPGYIIGMILVLGLLIAFLVMLPRMASTYHLTKNEIYRIRLGDCFSEKLDVSGIDMTSVRVTKDPNSIQNSLVTLFDMERTTYTNDFKDMTDDDVTELEKPVKPAIVVAQEMSYDELDGKEDELDAILNDIPEKEADELDDEATDEDILNSIPEAEESAEETQVEEETEAPAYSSPEAVTTDMLDELFNSYEETPKETPEEPAEENSDIDDLMLDEHEEQIVPEETQNEATTEEIPVEETTEEPVEETPVEEQAEEIADDNNSNDNQEEQNDLDDILNSIPEASSQETEEVESTEEVQETQSEDSINISDQVEEEDKAADSVDEFDEFDDILNSIPERSKEDSDSFNYEGRFIDNDLSEDDVYNMTSSEIDALDEFLKSVDESAQEDEEDDYYSVKPNQDEEEATEDIAPVEEQTEEVAEAEIAEAEENTDELDDILNAIPEKQEEPVAEENTDELDDILNAIPEKQEEPVAEENADELDDILNAIPEKQEEPVAEETPAEEDELDAILNAIPEKEAAPEESTDDMLNMLLGVDEEGKKPAKKTTRKTTKKTDGEKPAKKTTKKADGEEPAKKTPRKTKKDGE